MLWFWQHRVHLAINKYYERHILVMSSLRDLWYFPNVLYTIWCHEVIGTKRQISSTNKTDSWLSWNIVASCFQTSIILYIFLSDALIWFCFIYNYQYHTFRCTYHSVFSNISLKLAKNPFNYMINHASGLESYGVIFPSSCRPVELLVYTYYTYIAVYV